MHVVSRGLMAFSVIAIFPYLVLVGQTPHQVELKHPTKRCKDQSRDLQLSQG